MSIYKRDLYDDWIVCYSFVAADADITFVLNIAVSLEISSYGITFSEIKS